MTKMLKINKRLNQGAPEIEVYLMINSKKSMNLGDLALCKSGGSLLMETILTIVNHNSLNIERRVLNYQN
jgi:hypothetical protein